MHHNINRREFVVQSAAALAAAGKLARADETDTPTAAQPSRDAFQPIQPPAWVRSITRMTFAAPDDVPRAAQAGAQVVHGNMVWPYYPLYRDGGGLSSGDAEKLRGFVDVCHGHGVKLSLGLPPFPPAKLVQLHPEWRIHPDNTGAVLKLVAKDDDLGTRLCCNVGPWGDYLIETCAELVERFHVDGFSFDGNYHPTICYCPACKQAFRSQRARDLPAKADLDDVTYREYLVWRGEMLEQHYARLQRRIKAVNPDAVIMSWTVNAGRYGHFLYSPRAMPTRVNQLFDLPMQEWWLDETNVGASVAPAFGAAYLRSVAGDRPAAAEAYMMSRGNPYGTDSFPKHERVTRAMLALTNGCVSAESMGWPGHRESVTTVFDEVKRRQEWLVDARPAPWAALLVSEQTRQFYAYKDIAERFLPHVLGAFRTAMEEHLPLTLVNDWDVNPRDLAKFRVLVLPGAAALSNEQVDAVRQFVRGGGGLVASGEASLCDELGRPRKDFALADVFGASYRGRPDVAKERPVLDANFAATLDENYWRQRVGVAMLTWTDSHLVADERLSELVPTRSVTFRGPLVQVSEPAATEVAVRMTPAGWTGAPLPAIIARTFGAGRVVYLAAALDAAMWSYSYPYQRRLLAKALAWAAREPFAVSVVAPMCVQATFFTQTRDGRQRQIIHLFNGLVTTAHHGLPAVDVPLREETVPIHGIRVVFHGAAPHKLALQPGNVELKLSHDGPRTVVQLPPLEVHSLLVAEWRKRATKTPAEAPHAGPLDPELAAVVEAWPVLPEPIRAGIVAMVNPAGRKTFHVPVIVRRRLP